MSATSGEAMPRVQALGWINLFTNAADQIATVALPVVYVSQFHGDAGDNSILTIAATLPMLLLSLPLGTLADRVQLRSVLIGGELVRLLALVALILAFQLESPSLPLLALLALVGGSGTVAFQVAAPSMVARTTSGADRTRLNGSIELSRSIAVTAGPPAAGVLIGLAGGSLAFAVAVTMTITALLGMLSLPRITPSATQSAPLAAQLREGLHFTVRHPWLRPILMVSLGFNLAWYMLLGVIVAWTESALALTSSGIGVMFACYGIGMAVGASWMRRNGVNVPREKLIRIGPWCGFAFAVLIAMTDPFPHVWLLYLAFFLMGMGPTIWTVTTTGLRQEVTPHHLQGRVSATNMALSAGARPIGAALGFVFFTMGGFQAIFLVAIVIFGAQAIGIDRTVLVRGPREGSTITVPEQHSLDI